MDPDENGQDTQVAEPVAGGPTMRPSAALAFWLNDLRQLTGQTYVSLAKATGLSKTAINDALTGKTPMSHRTFFAVVAACGREHEPWQAYWEQMFRRVQEGDQPAPVTELTPPFRRPAPEEGGSAADDEAAPAPPLAIPHQAAPVDGPAPRRRRRALRSVLSVVGALMLFGAGALAGGVFVHHREPAVPASMDGDTMEVEWHHGGVGTWSDPATLSRPGELLPFGRWVSVQCRVYLPSVPSVSPDGYWYLIATAPWSGQYYAPANTFLNGDPEEGPYTHNTDGNVKKC